MLSSQYNIMFFQETHNTPDIENTCDKEWLCQIIYNHGENNAKGIIIAFNPKLCPNVHDTMVDEDQLSLTVQSFSTTLH